MGLLINNFRVRFDWFGELPMEYTNKSILHKDIYLGVQTNIVCLDDRPKDYKGFKIKCLENSGARARINGSDYYVTLPAEMQDVSATLYLGKIIFKKNKYGNLAPIYIPSTITESSFEGLNTFWLNEINPNTLPKPTPLEQAPGILDPLFIRDAIPGYNIDPEGYKYLKNFYFRSSKNITLNKDQIISYFTQLHTLNTTFIKNYIDSINNNNGIRANILHDTLYDELLEKGILQKDMFDWRYNGKLPYPKAKLIALDYFKKTHHSNFTIVFFDELFYAYLVWSLKEFTILYYSGYIAEQKNMLFNLGAYVDDRKLIGNENYETLGYRMGRYFYEHYIDMLTPEAKEDVRSFCNNAYGYSSYYNETTFLTDQSYYIPTDEAGHSRSAFQSPNRVYRTYPATGKPIYDDKKPPIYAPSPLGNYYFELTDNRGTFIEFFQRIYPSIDNPPQGWNKEMMKKLDLKLE